MNKDEALKMAIEALDLANGARIIEGIVLDNSYEINACKEALEQPAQEPVAWNEEEFNAIAYAYRTCPVHKIEMVSQRYQELAAYVLSIANNKKWQGLTADELEDIKDNSKEGWYQLVRNVEQALKEKNT
jgi:hypothetical protein